MEEKEKQQVKVIDIPTQFAKAFQLPDGTQMTLEEYLAWIGTEVYNLKKVWGK